MNRKTIPLLQHRRPPCESQDFSTWGCASLQNHRSPRAACGSWRTAVLEDGREMGGRSRRVAGWLGQCFFRDVYVGMCAGTHGNIWLRLARQFPLRFATRIHHGVMALQPLLLGFITRSLSPLPRLSELSTHKVTVNFSKVPRDEKCEEIVKQTHPTFVSPRVHAFAHS